MTKRVKFSLVIGGVARELSRVVFRSADGLWGVRLLNPDHDLVVPADTPLEPIAPGVFEYVYELENLDPGASYEYRVEWDYGGDTDAEYRTFLVPVYALPDASALIPGILVARNASGGPQAGVEFSFWMKDPPGDSALSYSLEPWTATSQAGDGLVVPNDFVRGARYEGRREPGGKIRGFTAPMDGDQFNLPEFLGPKATPV